MREDHKHSKYQDFVALLTLVLAAMLFYAYTYNRSSYSYILRADEGVSFATSLRVTQGFIPQHDFPAYYGPLMPYVYGTAFKILGPSIALMRALWAVLYVLSILLFYGLARHLMPPVAAFAGAAMVIGQQHTPLYTYNHIGFVLATQGILLLLFAHLSGKKFARFGLILGTLFLLAFLVKFNEAFVVFVMIAMAVAALNWLPGDDGEPRRASSERVRSRDVLIPGSVAVAAFLLLTAALNAGLTKSQFLRNFPILPQYQASIGGYRYVKLLLSIPLKTPWHQISAQHWYILWYENYIFAILVSFLIGFLALCCALIFVGSKKFRGRIQSPWKPVLLLAVAVGTYHEFYLTGNHWSTPMYIGFSLIGLTFLIFEGLARVPWLRLVVLSALLTLCIASDIYYLKVVHATYSQYHFAEARARFYSSDDSDAPVTAQVVAFLEQAVPAKTPIAAFPHDAALIYLSGHQNAMRDDDYQWMLFPDPESDAEVVRELQSTKVPSILVSNFVGVRHGRPVIFGRDYLPETFKYIQSHYVLMKTFGNDPRGYRVQYLELETSTAGSQ